jgi:hypothetical protein
LRVLVRLRPGATRYGQRDRGGQNIFMFHVFVSLNKFKANWYLADRQRAGHGLLNAALQSAPVVRLIDSNMLFSGNIMIERLCTVLSSMSPAAPGLTLRTSNTTGDNENCGGTQAAIVDGRAD